MDRQEALTWFSDRLSETDRAEAETFLNETFQAYDDLVASSKAKAQEYEDRQAKDRETIQALKAKNFDLLMATPKDEPEDNGEPIENNVADDGEVYHISDLFETKEVR